MDTYPTFLAVMWCAGLCLSQGKGQPANTTLPPRLSNKDARIHTASLRERSASHCCLLTRPLWSEAPAAFAGIIYLVVRQKYFVGYMGQTSQRYQTNI